MGCVLCASMSYILSNTVPFTFATVMYVLIYDFLCTVTFTDLNLLYLLTGDEYALHTLLCMSYLFLFYTS